MSFNRNLLLLAALSFSSGIEEQERLSQAPVAQAPGEEIPVEINAQLKNTAKLIESIQAEDTASQAPLDPREEAFWETAALLEGQLRAKRMRFGIYEHPRNRDSACLRWRFSENTSYMISLAEPDLEDSGMKYTLHIYKLEIKDGKERIIDEDIIGGEDEVEIAREAQVFIGEDAPSYVVMELEE